MISPDGRSAMGLAVRDAEPRDLAALLRLLRAKAAFDGVPHMLQATEDNLGAELFSPRPRVRALLACIGTGVVGMATYSETFSSFLMKPGLWLDDLYVDERHRQCGVGRELLRVLCGRAQAAGCARIDWIVATRNGNGRSFYERMGAEIFDSVRLARLDAQAIGVHAITTNSPT
jgi:GNAT superfamily N-acetyltransferase